MPKVKFVRDSQKKHNISEIKTSGKMPVNPIEYLDLLWNEARRRNPDRPVADWSAYEELDLTQEK